MDSFVYGRTPGMTYLAFDEQGNVIKNNSLDSNYTSTLTFKDKNSNGQTQLSYDEGTKTFVVTNVDANGNNNWNDGWGAQKLHPLAPASEMEFFCSDITNLCCIFSYFVL